MSSLGLEAGPHQDERGPGQARGVVDAIAALRRVSRHAQRDEACDHISQRRFEVGRDEDDQVVNPTTYASAIATPGLVAYFIA